MSFGDYEQYIDKLNTSESLHHERDSEMKDKKPMENYEQEGGEKKEEEDDRSYEVSGIKNSFDNISIGADRKGAMTISVSSGKDYKKPALGNDRKRLRDSRKRRAPEHFGEFFTNLTSGGDGAFAFRTDKNLSERRVLTEFKRAAKKRVSERRREAVPFLNIEEDIARLNRMKSESGSTNEASSARARLENQIVKRKEFQKRFVRKIKSARRRTLVKDDEPERDIFNIPGFTGDNADQDPFGGDTDDDIIDELLDDEEEDLLMGGMGLSTEDVLTDAAVGISAMSAADVRVGAAGTAAGFPDTQGAGAGQAGETDMSSASGEDGSGAQDTGTGGNGHRGEAPTHGEEPLHAGMPGQPNRRLKDTVAGIGIGAAAAATAAATAIAAKKARKKQVREAADGELSAQQIRDIAARTGRKTKTVKSTAAPAQEEAAEKPKKTRRSKKDAGE